MDTVEPPGSSPTPEGERQIQALVESYIDQVQSGPPPDLIALLARHLPMVREATQRLSTVALLYGLGESTVDSSHGGPAAANSRGSKPESRFQRGEVLGKGHSAVVYRARDTLLGREVALKVFRTDGDEGDTRKERFLQDARIAASLRHPNIVPIFDYGAEADRVFLVMELVEGGTLENRLRTAGSNPFTPREAAELVRTLALALHHAHRHGIIHRDVKPSNILLRSAAGSDQDRQPRSPDGPLPINASPSDCQFHDVPLLTDFGLARQVNAPAGFTAERQVMGTPGYMPPEQAIGNSALADARSDGYSLGVVFYRLLTGRLPYEQSTSLLATSLLTEPVPPPRMLNPDLPRDLETICLKALEPEPADRFPTTAEFAEELRRWLADEPIATRPPGLLGRLRRCRRRNRTLTSVLAGAAVAMLMLTVFLGGLAVIQRNKAIENENRSHYQEELNKQEIRLRAETAAWAALEKARQIVMSPMQGRRWEAQSLLQGEVAKHRREMGPKADRERLDLAIRSLYAQTLAVPDLAEGPTDENYPASAIELPSDQFRTWHMALHPSQKILAIGTHRGPVRWRIGQPTLEGIRPTLPRPGIWFSPDGKFLAQAGAHGGLQVWDESVNPAELRLDWNSKALVVAVYFNPVQQRFYAVDSNGILNAWNLSGFTDRSETCLTDASAPVTAAAFDRNHGQVAWGHKSRVFVCSLGGTGARLLLFTGSAVEALAWSPDGQLLAAGTHDGVIRLMKEDGTPMHHLVAFNQGVTNLCFAPQGDWLAAGFRSGTTHIWQIPTGELLLTIPNRGIPWGFAQDGRHLVLGNSGSAMVCALARPQVIRRLMSHRTPLARLAWSADSRHLITLDTHFEVRVWDVALDAPIDAFPGPASDGDFWADNGAIAVTFTGRLAAYASSGNEHSYLLLRDCQTHQDLNTWTLGGGYEELAAIGPEAFLLVREEIAEDKRNVRTVSHEVRPGQLGVPRVLRRPEARDAERFFSQDLTPDGKLYAWCGPRKPRFNPRVIVLDVRTGRTVFSRRLEVVPNTDPDACLSPSGHWLWVNNGTDFSFESDLQGQTVTSTYGDRPLSLSRDGRWAAFHGRSSDSPALGVARLGSWPDRSALIDLSPPSPRTLARKTTAFSPDGHYFAWEDGTGTVAVADLPTLHGLLEAFLTSIEVQ